jgi:DNA-binding NarL/FixJ family response regulator
MLVVEPVGRIRRALVKGKSIKEIVRELKVSRNTVHKVLRSGAICLEYAREVRRRCQVAAASSAISSAIVR